jgi:hypothetical protein
MFAFGIFTSYLPYLIMGILYMAYFSVSMLAANKAELKDDKTIVLTSEYPDAKITPADEKTYEADFHEFAPQIQAITQESTLIINCSSSPPPDLYQTTYFRNGNLFSLFSRPPPVSC